jgi:hypothetical protein
MPTTNNNNAANEAASFIFTPATDLKPGEYTLMLGAQDNEVGMLKTVKVNIIS